MTITQFSASLTDNTPPAGINALLQALWYDQKGDWSTAHSIAQEIHTDDGSWIHAYLHRKEGDTGNAAYWYHMANKPYPTVSLQNEWKILVDHFLQPKAVASAK